MNIKELMNASANVSVMVTLPDLREFVSEMVAEAAFQLKQKERRNVFNQIRGCESFRSERKHALAMGSRWLPTFC